ncbi:TIGR04190 family B12-binding domain/radical SAM domain protein [candidate division KSB1 bacterium]|nr:TIGR04190 family B12-binding domain/radical SAM domain protein [candidate division KSB1 bacterium]
MTVPSLFQTDLVLLHAPSVYDFRKIPRLFGPVSDVIPSTPIFEMYPIGFTSIAAYLKQHQLVVRIVNLAYRMLQDPHFDVEKFIARLKPRMFGIDLHWLPHAHGSIEVAKICKKYHPQIPVLFGGYSATYFHQELIQYPAVDFVLRGDSTEDSVRQLVQQCRQKSPNYYQIPGLTWKDETGQIIVNAAQQNAVDLNRYANNYIQIFKMAVKYLDIKSLIAIRDWWEYPITAIMTCRGCTQNCSICGGSHRALMGYTNRQQPTFRAPILVAREIIQMHRFTRAPIFIVGDLHQAGYDYAQTLLSHLKKARLQNELVFELFTPAREEFFEWIAAAAPNFNFEMSPESHDLAVRRMAGKNFTNEALETNIQWALDYGCKKFDIFFMIGLSNQTFQSVMETVDYCEKLIAQFGTRVNPFISPLAPFLDPGSIAYENPSQYGYKIRFKTLEAHRQALLQPSWKHVLNYETEWMDREMIVQATYAAGKKLTEIKAKYGMISQIDCAQTLANLSRALQRHAEIEQILATSAKSKVSPEEVLQRLHLDMEQDSIASICSKRELRWPQLRGRFKFTAIIKAILFE